MSGLEGKVALITGGATGIGRATALLFAREGACVLIGDINEEGASETVEAVRAAGGDAAFRRCDVSGEEEIAALVAAAGEEYGRLDVVFGNAGLLRTRPLEDLSTKEFELHLRINLTANFLLTKYAAPVMRRHEGGSIIFMASAGGLRGTRGSVAYNASKGGLVNMTRSLADELAPHNIRVNCVCPGWVDTPFNRPFWEHAGAGAEEEVLRGVPLRRQCTPEEVAPAVVFLAGEGASYITGEALVIDGGMLAT
ncbi:short-chain dehydrogenase/reductase SDR [Rubrobacter xylanophilus DSM 9941]|uniref:Short-chain dehydrogenase/reductase SDR n=1 Tax=Rubrobacter xylanophilus (strain DSM 9941 / JCM 11954 / NBRC 16129 / PRD-1) TaxID=266117 RepID=Q1ARM4_RUBXD|nr:SDR family NAD(P)-dependent oxidoreductase [Rubrobacter xylanophilus]ABG05954.1 short-chain dehydrogenase/reductase SDR [Rubrobacter xylanophilus DSM 9941]